MKKILLGQKIGMTQTWDDKGRLVAGTVIHCQPNSVLTDNNKILLATTREIGRTNKAQGGIASQIGSKRGIRLKEVTDIETDQKKLDVGHFNVGEKVKVAGISKGKGFAGTIKRHNFHRGPVSHGSDNIRRPGSIGAQQPQRVPRGQKMAGQMGNVPRTVRGGKVLSVDQEKNVIVVSGNIPGPARGNVVIETI